MERAIKGLSNLLALFFVLALFIDKLYAQAETSFKFDFGAGETEEGFIQVVPSLVYTPEAGYGFDFGSRFQSIVRHGTSNLISDLVRSNSPFFFSVAVPEGNYQITLTFGDQERASQTTVKAESRRLMLENVSTKAGEFVKKTIIVNVKNRKIDAAQTVLLKARELTKLDWDEKLTLEFDINTALVALEIEKVDNQITVFLAGNSTVVNQEDEPWASWGQMIPRFFKPGVAISNHAESGLSLGSFLSSQRLTKILSIMKPGDYLFIEFGHNDQKEKGPNDGAFQSYTERLKFFVSEVKKLGGIPVILTSTHRRTFGEQEMIVNSLGDYPEAARRVAASENVSLIDLNEATAAFYNALGKENSKKAFVHYPANTWPGQKEPLADDTHFSTYGAYQLAKCVIEGIKKAKLGLTDFLLDPDVHYDPSQPDSPHTWIWPATPKIDLVKPDGN